MTFWTNRSVLTFAGSRDPETVIIESAREVALQAMSEGWKGPPYDPFELAERLGVAVVARDDLYDARTIAGSTGRMTLEYNPSRPRGRVRYSVAHELAHLLFPDAAEQVRYRSAPDGPSGDDWQLEMLCNIAAGELLMPAGTFPELTHEALDIEHLMSLQRTYDVSTEALFLRVARLSDQPATMFAASRANADIIGGPLHVDYWRGTRTWTAKLRQGVRLRKDSAAYECTAVGYTARGDERWPEVGDVHVEVVGIPPYPGQRLPRVVGLLRPNAELEAHPEHHIEYVRGDATRPRGGGRRVIAHVVNDRTPNWGGAFARALRDKYPVAQDSFRAWVRENRQNLRLGAAHCVTVDEDEEVAVATMVAQRGYGQSRGMRLRYDALLQALNAVAEFAARTGASVHMPRIGAGQAGGSWDVIAELIDTAMGSHGVDVVVYSRPGDEWPRQEPRQQTLSLALE